MKNNLLLVCLILWFKAGAQDTIRVNAGIILKKVPRERVGINLNYLTDDQPNTEQALKDLGVKFLRFPGGEKSDNYFWGQRPFNRANHTLALTGNCHWPNNDSRFTYPDHKSLMPNTLDFDEFMILAGKTGSQPLIVLNADSHHNTGSTCGGVPVKDSLITIAREWVRYANVVKKYNIKYWMIGNESFKSAAYAGKVTPQQYRDDVIDFSRALKSIDPTIKIVVNGDTSDWWRVLLTDSVATSYIDYLGVSAYPLWNWEKGYQNYSSNLLNFAQTAQTASMAIDSFVKNPQDRGRIRLMVTETNALDFGATPWPNTNDLGHALVLFDIIGQHLITPKVDFTFFWNTRWVDNKRESLGFNALTSSGELLANGLVLSLWNKYLLDNLVATTSSKSIITYASTSQNQMVVFLINKDSVSHEVALQLKDFKSQRNVKRVLFKGNSLSDSIPTISNTKNLKIPIRNKDKGLTIPTSPQSITILLIKRRKPLF